MRRRGDIGDIGDIGDMGTRGRGDAEISLSPHLPVSASPPLRVSASFSPPTTRVYGNMCGRTLPFGMIWVVLNG